MPKEELTAKMHSEFTISDETNIKHKCFAALNDMLKYNYTIEEASKTFGVTITDIKKYTVEFDELNS